MELLKPYKKCKEKEYRDLMGFFSGKMDFTKKDDLEDVLEDVKEKIEKIKEEKNISRVWLLFAKRKKNSNWKCLQVAQSKKSVESEINEVIDYLFKEFNQNSESISFTNSAFYEKVCPKPTNEDKAANKDCYRKLLYSKIGSEYEYFRICFLNVDKYLGTKPDNSFNKTDTERIIQICKNQYAEAKIAYQTLAVYWRQFSSGIDGQTINYIANHTSEFK